MFLCSWIMSSTLLLLSATTVVDSHPVHEEEKWMNSVGIHMAQDTNPDPDIFETTITASEAEIEIDGTMVKALAYNGQIPGPMIRVKEGDRVIVHFVNNLPFTSTLHWHGVAGNHEADGSQISQYAVAPGETFLYDFVAANAGNHWYHSHDKTAETLFKGLYGPLIVVSQDEQDLKDNGVLPEVEGTIVLSDTTFDYAGNVAEVYLVPELAKMNGIEGSTLLVNGKFNPKIHVEASKPFMLRIINTSISRYWRLSLDNGGELIRVGGEDGLIDEAILEGGSHSAMQMDMPPISCDNATDCSESKYPMCMPMMKKCGAMTMWDTGFDAGEIVLGPAMRATVVINPPEEKNQEVLLQWKDFDRGVHSMQMDMGGMCETVGSMQECNDPDYPMCMMMMGGMKKCGKMCMSSNDCPNKDDYPQCMLMMKGGMAMCGKMVHGGHTPRPSVDILRIQTKKSEDTYDKFEDGTSLCDGSSCTIKNLSSQTLGVPDLKWTGMMDRINLQGGMNEMGTWFKIDNVQWSYGMGSTNSFPDPPQSQRHAQLGNLIEFEVHNHSDMNHPFHLHGFSFQPISFMEMDHHMGTMKHFNYRSLEFMDTVDIPPHTSMVARVLSEDLVGGNAAAGRWLFHCHIAQHAELGMISEIDVAEN